ncbi:MAG: thiamine pyrophosphate-binding protein [Verrucomicrobiaceae bacterium]
MNTEADIVAQLLSLGCDEFVVCGGARNAVLVSLLTDHPTTRIFPHFEERGAAFFALGRTKATGLPCAVVTTSGTAVAECLPAVIEAHYSALPLIIVSADRPAEYRGTGAPQAIEQEGIFTTYAHLGPDWKGHGPLHLNVELGEATLPEKTATHPPAEPFLPARRPFAVLELRDFITTNFIDGLIVMLGGLDEDDREDTYHFLNTLGVPVVADVTSGLREALHHLIIPDAVVRKKLPGKILRLGEVPVGRLWRDLEDHPEVDVLSITRNGLPGLARPSSVIAAEVGRVIRGYGDVDELGDIDDDLPAARRSLSRTDELLEGYPDSEPGLIRTLSVYATTSESLFLGNSLPIREWNDFAQRRTPYTNVRANRGANGIDGQISTWLGATAEEPDAWGVFGDLTTLYDLAAPALFPQVQTEGRVLVVINNHGGRIFERLPRLEGMDAAQHQAVVQPQSVDFSKWAEMWNFQHLRITCTEDFDLLDTATSPLLLEIVPDQEQTDAFWKAFS